ncbi:hypothetical protein JTY60_01970 [symbiont of Argiope bruennichi]|uniref:hypothetical protein n=1 Tax=symbiont of Argiope bruennichi TaxID=2810479 RepID=UPI003DA41021
MFDIDKLETNIIELVKNLNNNKIIAETKFKNIYQVNEKLISKFEEYYKSLRIRKITNNSEIPLKFSENIKYFNNFSFIKKKHFLENLNKLDSNEKKIINNQIIDEVINFLENQKLKTPAIIWLGHQKISDVEKIIEELNFFNNDIELSFSSFFSKVKEFNKIEKKIANNLYKEILELSANNSQLSEKLKKINKNYFSLDDYLAFKNVTNNNPQEILNDEENETDLVAENFANNLNNYREFKDYLNTKEEEIFLLFEIAKVINIDNNKNLLSFKVFYHDILKNNIEKDLLKEINFSRSFWFFENSEKNLVTFNFSENFTAIKDQFDLYFEKLTNEIKSFALIYLGLNFNFAKNFSETQKNIIEDLPPTNIVDFFKLNSTYDKLKENIDDFSILETLANDIENLPNDLISNFIKGQVNYQDFSIKITLSKNEINKIFSPWKIQKYLDQINYYLSNNTIIKFYFDEEHEKLNFFIEQVKHTNNSFEFSSNVILKNSLKNLYSVLNNLIYEVDNKQILNFTKLYILEKNKESQDRINFDSFLLSKNYLEIKNQLNKLFFSSISQETSELENYFSSEITKYANLKHLKDLFKAKFDLSSYPMIKMDDIDNFLNFPIIIIENLKNIFNHFNSEIKDLHIFTNYIQGIFFNVRNYEENQFKINNFFIEIAREIFIKWKNNFDIIFKNNINLADENDKNFIAKIDYFISMCNDSYFDAISYIDNLFENYQDIFYDWDKYEYDLLFQKKQNIDKILKEIRILHQKEKAKILYFKNSNFFSPLFLTPFFSNNMKNFDDIEKMISTTESSSHDLYFYKDHPDFSYFNLIKTKNMLKNGYFSENLTIKAYQDFFENIKKQTKNPFNASDEFEKILNINSVVEINSFIPDIYNFSILKEVENDVNNFLITNKVKDFFEKIINEKKTFLDYYNNFLDINNFLSDLLNLKKEIGKVDFHNKLNNEQKKLDKKNFFYQKKLDILEEFKKYDEKIIVNKITKNNTDNRDLVYTLRDTFLEKFDFFCEKILLNSDDREKFFQIFYVLLELLENSTVRLNLKINEKLIDINISLNESKDAFLEKLDNLKDTINKFFISSFLNYFLQFTKKNHNIFYSLVWDKIIKESPEFQKLLASIDDEKTFNVIDDDNNLKNLFNIKDNLLNNFKKITIDQFLDESLEDINHKFFHFSVDDLYSYNEELLTNIELGDFLFIKEFRNELKKAILNNDLDVLKKILKTDKDSLKSFETLEEFKILLSIIFKDIYQNDLLLTNKIMNNFIKIFQTNLNKIDENNFINIILTSSKNEDYKLLFNFFKKNSNLNYDNLKIINNLLFYTNYIKYSYWKIYSKDKIKTTNEEILTLFKISSDIEKYFLTSAKAYLYLNNNIIKQNKSVVQFVNEQDPLNNLLINEKLEEVYFDFTEEDYDIYLNGINSSWNIKELKNLFKDLFAIKDNLSTFFDKGKKFFVFSNKVNSDNFINQLDKYNKIFKQNYLEYYKNSTIKFYKSNSNLKLLDAYNFENKKKYFIAKNIFLTENIFQSFNFENLDIKNFLNEVESIATDGYNLSDTVMYIANFQKQVILNLKKDLDNDKNFNFLKKINKKQLKELKSFLPAIFKLYFLSEVDLNLNHSELYEKYKNSHESEYVFKDYGEYVTLIEDLLTQYKSFDDYKEKFKEELERFFVNSEKNITNENLKLRSKIIFLLTKDQNFLNEIFALKNKLTNKEQEIVDLFLKDNFSPTEIEWNYQQFSQNYPGSENPFSDDKVDKILEQIETIYQNSPSDEGKLLRHLTYLIKKTSSIYYPDIFLVDNNNKTIVSKLDQEITKIFQKIKNNNTLSIQYTINLGGNIDLSSNDFETKINKYFLEQIFSKIILLYYDQSKLIENNFPGFFEKNNLLFQSESKEIVENFFNFCDTYKQNNNFVEFLASIEKELEDKNIQEIFNFFNFYLESKNLALENYIKNHVITFLNDLKNKSIIYNNSWFFNLGYQEIKPLNNLDFSKLHFELNDLKSLTNIKNVGKILFNINPINQDFESYSLDDLNKKLLELENLYLSKENLIIEQKLDEISLFYLDDLQNTNFKGYFFDQNFTSSNNFIPSNFNYSEIKNWLKSNLTTDKNLRFSLFFNLYHLSQEGKYFASFLKGQETNLNSYKIKILNENFNYYGYNFGVKLTSLICPSIIDEILGFKFENDRNVSEIFKNTFLVSDQITRYRNFIKNNFAHRDLDTIAAVHSSIFYGYWHKSNFKSIENFPIDYKKTALFIEKENFDFFDIFKRFAKNLKQIVAEQEEIKKNFEKIIFENFNNIRALKSDKMPNKSIKKENNFLHSFINKNNEKIFIIGADYGILTILKTKDLNKNIFDNTIKFLDIKVVDLANDKTYELSNNSKITIDLDEITEKDNIIEQKRVIIKNDVPNDSKNLSEISYNFSTIKETKNIDYSNLSSFYLTENDNYVKIIFKLDGKDVQHDVAKNSNKIEIPLNNNNYHEVLSIYYQKTNDDEVSRNVSFLSLNENDIIVLFNNLKNNKRLDFDTTTFAFKVDEATKTPSTSSGNNSLFKYLPYLYGVGAIGLTSLLLFGGKKIYSKLKKDQKK